MKKRVFFTAAIIICGVFITTANEIEQLKKAITSQLISDNINTPLVKSLADTYFPDGVETDQCLMEVVAYALPSDEEVEGILSSMTNNESWDDIDYRSPARSAWVGREHVKRVLKMARCYKSEHSKFYNSAAMLESINRAIEYWCDGEFICTNWWYNAIGVPKEFAPVLLLLEDDLSEELMAKGIQILEPAELEMTGQNKVWLNGVTFIKGLLLGDTSILERTSQAIKSELRLSEDEGIQLDYSFHQHGAMQQFGNYGLAFASSQSYWMRIFSGTSYDFTPEQKEIMRSYFTRGINSTIWRGYMDMSSCGRQLFHNSQAGKGASLLLSNINMMEVDADSASVYESYIYDNYLTPQRVELSGNFAFPISKYTVHRTPDFLFSVKMCSRNILGGEVTNRENLKGYHLADGATMIYRTGREYENISAVWDGKYMPGTTVEMNDSPLKVLKDDKSYLNGSDFVGCMSHGEYGLTAMEYRRDGVSANKSWFFLGDLVLCLGNGLESKSGDPLVTTLNQCNYQDRVLYLSGSRIVESEMERSYSATRLFADGVGYASLDGSSIEFIAREQLGDWHSVADFYPSSEVRQDVFTAQIHHGAEFPASYAYLVSPNAKCSKFLKNKSAEPFEILQNDSVATAVEIKKEQIVMVVFWQAGVIESSTLGSISAPSPVMLILSKDSMGNIARQEYFPL